MNYGEQRYKENIKDLTPEQKARQTLALEAFKEQVAYERSQRRKIAKAAKDTFKRFSVLNYTRNGCSDVLQL